MSSQSGIWHFDRRPVSPEMLGAFESRCSGQGPDKHGQFIEPGFAMLYDALFIKAEDSGETQPNRDANGNYLTWDGRLDNREALLAELGRSTGELLTDVEIVAEALSIWGKKAFARFVGDWALAWWNPFERRLTLARDYIGVRKLYYLTTRSSIYWSTDIGALVLHSGETYSLCDEYFAEFFTSASDPCLTPYSELLLVPPGGYLEATPDRCRVHRYWTFNDLPKIRYRSDAEYEEHFRLLFRQSVRRRLRTTYPILADLSGGLDSSSIVCTAFDILKSGETTAKINTISRYSFADVGGDERCYFMDVERLIGQVGTHLERHRNAPQPLISQSNSYFFPLPGYFDGAIEAERAHLQAIGSQGNRLHLTGHGGDELLGGVPSPVPQLAVLLWSLHITAFWSHLENWAIKRKLSIYSLVGSSLAYLAPRVICSARATSPPMWLKPEFLKRQASRRRRNLSGNWRNWLPGPPDPDIRYLTLASTLNGRLPPLTYAEELAMPFFDQNLVSFLFAIPREQILRPHERRSLMRRALKGVLPESVRTRKTKWIGARRPLLEIEATCGVVDLILPNLVHGREYVDVQKLQGEFKKIQCGERLPILPVLRLIASLSLIQSLNNRHLLLGNSGSQSRLPVGGVSAISNA